jgi:hypothetical protein
LAPSIASFTARLSYDSTALRYIDEVAIADSATRVINPTTGALRLAGIAPSGFADGRLSELRFVELRTGGVSTLRLTMDEMHTTTRSDALSSLATGTR